MDSLSSRVYEVQGALGFVRAKEEELNAEKAKLETLILQVKRLTRAHSQYSVLTRAFDRNGIPTLIIENVIPEIEETIVC